jgi:hypothetical protein
MLSCLYVQLSRASKHNAFAFLFANLLQKLVKCRVRVRKRSHHNGTMEHKRTEGSSFWGGKQARIAFCLLRFLSTPPVCRETKTSWNSTMLSVCREEKTLRNFDLEFWLWYSPVILGCACRSLLGLNCVDVCGRRIVRSVFAPLFQRSYG